MVITFNLFQLVGSGIVVSISSCVVCCFVFMFTPLFNCNSLVLGWYSVSNTVVDFIYSLIFCIQVNKTISEGYYS